MSIKLIFSDVAVFTFSTNVSVLGSFADKFLKLNELFYPIDLASILFF